MKTMDLAEAATFLKMKPEAMRRLAASGKIPAAKPGKRWCFIESDLVNYLQLLYSQRAKMLTNIQREDDVWHSISERMSGGLKSDIMDNEYRKALGLVTK